ncbi:MAG: phospholipid carrier-dependent glycosyltransferase [Thermoanaerobaculia bacterium]
MGLQRRDPVEELTAARPGASRAIPWLLLLLAGLVFFELPGSHLLEPDEARYAEIPREMLETGDWVTPRVNRQPYFEKPPLLYWANAAAFRVFGQNPYAARLTSRLSTLAVAVMLLFALRRRGDADDPLEGALAAAIYLSSLLPFLLSRQNLIDPLLTAATTASLLSLREFARRREDGKSGQGWLAAAAVAGAAGTLAKGLVAVVIPGLVFVVWALLIRRPRLIREAIVSPAALLYVALAIPWFVAMERANPAFLDFFFVREHFGRFTGGAKRSETVVYFIPVLLIGFLPWTLFAGRIVRLFRPFSLERMRGRPDAAFFLVWAVSVFLFFSLSRSKLIPYVLPAFPALAALAARGILVSPGAPGGRFRAAAGGAALVFFAVAIAQPRLTREHTAHAFVEAYRRYAREGIPLVTYHTFLHGLPWELRREVPMASWVGELRPAYERDMHHPLFWQEPTFWYRWNRGEKLVVLTRTRDRDEFRLRSAIPFTHLLTVRDHVLLANFPLE